MPTNQEYLRIRTGCFFAEFDKGFCRETEALDFVTNIDRLMQQGTCLKKDDASFVSRFVWNNKVIVVKQYIHRGLFHSIRHTIRRSRARRCWINGHKLLDMGISTPVLLAYVEERKGFLLWQSYLITEYIDGKKLSDIEMDKNISQQQLSEVIIQVKKFLDKLIQHRVSHGDLKHSNIMITQNGPFLIDLDATRVHKFNVVYKLRRARDVARFKEDIVKFAGRRAQN
jgi:tRNA A-37 threonylcarbamoyl transferase component Bud32